MDYIYNVIMMLQGLLNNKSKSFKKGKYKQSNTAEEDEESVMCIKHNAPETPTKNIEMAISPLINEKEAYELY